MFSKKIIAKNFSRGVKAYDETAVVQRKAAGELCELILPFLDTSSLAEGRESREFKSKPKLARSSAFRAKDDEMCILDLGSGTSFVAKKLLTGNLQLTTDDRRLTPDDLKIFELDLSAEMLQSWRDRPANVFPIQGDIENPPFKNHSFDLIISSFSLQWIEDFEKTFSKIFSLLKPNGTFAFCVPTSESLPELRAENIFNLNDLPKIKDLKSALKKSGFVEIFFQKKIVKQNFENGYEALNSLKKIGANYSKKKEKKITKTQLKHFRLKNFQRENKNLYSLTWIEAYFILKCSEKF